MSSAPLNLGALRVDFGPTVKYKNSRYSMHDTYWYSGRICTRVRTHVQPSNRSLLDDSSAYLHPRPEHTHGCLAYGHGRSIWRSLSFFIERWEREKREVAERPALAIGEISKHIRIFKIRSGSETKELYAYVIMATVTNESSVTAFDIMAGGSIAPPLDPGAIMPYGWWRGARIYERIIDIFPPFPGDRPVVEEIGTQILQRITRECEILIPDVTATLVLGLTLSKEGKPYPFAFIGDHPIQLPYEGSIVVRVYNEKFGHLAEKSFKVKIKSYSEVSFE